MDGFCEQVVKTKRSATDKILAVVYVLMSLLIPAVCITLAYVIVAYFVYIGLFLLMALVPLSILLIKNQNIEYEYQVVDDYIAVDKIVAKRKRKKVVRMKMDEFKNIIKFNDKNYNDIKINKYYICVDDIDADDVYAFIFYNEARGNCALVIRPNEKILKGMRPKLQTDLQVKVIKILREQNDNS